MLLMGGVLPVLLLIGKVAGIEVPPFEDVDNPGGWSRCAFQPKCKRDNRGRPKEHMCHSLPTGATPVPLQDGKCKAGGWEFRHQGWENTQGDYPIFRSGATKDDPFPDSRKGSLDREPLEKLGLDEQRMNEDDGSPDALFFHQLSLPVCKTSGIEGDPCLCFHLK